MNSPEISEDEFLGGLISLRQPKKGYRITSDTVFLAASLNVSPGETILDIGSGTGGILSCYAARIGDDAKNIAMTGIEVQEELILLARRNNEKISYVVGDIMADVEDCEANSFDHVVTNPPYYEKGNVTTSPYKSKAVAHGNEMNDLTFWIERCLRMVRPKGFLHLVHRADRLDDIVAALKPKTGSITIFPMYPKSGNDANRVIIRAQKGSKGHLTLKSGLIVHKSDGKYTDAAEDVLRRAQFLNIDQ